MNTTKKGNAFEDKVFGTFRDMLLNGKLPVRAECCRIFQKKGYFSKDRGKNIIIDVSIEITHPGANEYSMLWLIECKSYSHKVPVDDIEEFYSKVLQITGVNVKATFVTDSALQEGALNFAKAKKMSVVRVLPQNQVQFVKYNLSSDYFRNWRRYETRSIKKALASQEYIGENSIFWTFDGRNYHKSLIGLFRGIIKREAKWAFNEVEDQIYSSEQEVYWFQ